MSQKTLKRFLKVIDCTQQLQVRENVVGFEKALGAVKVIKDQIQYRSQTLLNLARDYFRPEKVLEKIKKMPWKNPGNSLKMRTKLELNIFLQDLYPRKHYFTTNYCL